MNIPFNKPYFIGNEIEYIIQAVSSGKISGNGKFTKLCHNFFEKTQYFKKVLLTTSCTDALEMSAILCNISPGDEVIVPSFTFVSTANAFVLRGAKIIFADSRKDHPNIDENRIEELITEKTKAIVPVHYAGVSCNMDKIMNIAKKYNIYVIEDAAQAIDSYYYDKPLGTIGDLACFSFHETKNIIAGEGGLLAVNNERFINRSEIIWEKGTNRAEFFRGEVDKYGWVDIGSSFLPSELTSAFLFAQLENISLIQKKRKRLWNNYYSHLKILEDKGYIKLPVITKGATNNAHMFYFICRSENERTMLILFLKRRNILAVFHYLPLHKSKYYQKYQDNRDLKFSVFFSKHLVRLPLFFDLSETEQSYIIDSVFSFYK